MYFSLSFHLSFKCNLFFHFRYELLQHATLTSVTLPQHKGYNKGIIKMLKKILIEITHCLIVLAVDLQLRLKFKRCPFLDSFASLQRERFSKVTAGSKRTPPNSFKICRLFTRATCLHFFLKPGHFWQSRIAQ